MGRRHPCGDRDTALFRGAHEIERGARGHLPEMQPRTRHFGQRDIARNRQRFRLRRRAGKAEPGRHIACGGHRAAHQRCVLGVGDHDHIQHRRVAQQAQHHAAVVDPAPSGRDAPGARIPHQREFRQLPALQPSRRRAQRVNPQIRLAAIGQEANARRMVQRRRLIGHQRRAGDATEMKGRLVHREYAQVDQTGRDQLAARIDLFISRFRREITHCGNAPVDQAKRTFAHAIRAYQAAAGDGDGPLLLHTSRP